MKKLLIASTALVATAGVAAADVSVGGDGRMGLTYNGVDKETRLNSRIRINFSASGETDNGLAFGGSIGSHDVNAGTAGNAGSIFVSGDFGKLSMGDVDGAAKAAVGHVSGVGYTGLASGNELIFINSGTDLDGDSFNDTIYPTPSALYEFSTGSTTFYAGIGQIGGQVIDFSGDGTNVGDFGQSYSIGVKWANDNGLTLSGGYETTQSVMTTNGGDIGNISQIILGAQYATSGGFTFKGVYGQGDLGTIGDMTQYAVSVDYSTGATTFTGFYRVTDIEAQADKLTSYGIGAAYDLGGGATVAAGWTRYDADGVGSADSADLGVKFSF